MKQMEKKKQLRYDRVYMKIASEISELSYAQRAKVGCVIVSDDGQILSQGFNGMPSGFDNCCEEMQCTLNSVEERNEKCPRMKELGYISNCDPNECEYCVLKTKDEVLHAESNAISKCAKYMSSTNGATLYVTLSPCKECAKLIAQSGIKRVVYRDSYRDMSGIDFLNKTNITVEQLTM